MLPPMAQPACKQDPERQPLIEDNNITEIVNGQVITMPRPGPSHAVVSLRMGGDLNGPFDRGQGGPGGWWIIGEPEIHFGDDRLVPDLAGWRRERMPELPQTASFPPCDWVCEVLSPSTEARDRGEKMPIYARHQVAHVWLVDPLVQTLEVFKLEGGRYFLLGVYLGAAKVRAEPFQEVELDFGSIWA